MTTKPVISDTVGIETVPFTTADPHADRSPDMEKASPLDPNDRDNTQSLEEKAGQDEAYHHQLSLWQAIKTYRAVGRAALLQLPN